MTKIILYKIYYGHHVVYVGRTHQPLQDRIRGHFFNRPMHRAIDIFRTTKIEFAELPTIADLYLYEVYYINKLKPPYNCDDKAHDELSVKLPELEFKEFECKLMDKWKEKIKANNEALEAKEKAETEFLMRKAEMRRKRRDGEITEDEYYQFIDGGSYE